MIQALLFMCGVLMVGLSHFHEGAGTDWPRYIIAMNGLVLTHVVREIYRGRK